MVQERQGWLTRLLRPRRRHVRAGCPAGRQAPPAPPTV